MTGTALAITAMATPVLANGNTATSAEATAKHHEEGTTLHYPETKRENVTENHFGITIEDPYRWLENDVREDDNVAQWVDAQNKVANQVLDTLPGRDALAADMREVYDYERFGIPVVKNGRFFYGYNSGLLN